MMTDPLDTDAHPDPAPVEAPEQGSAAPPEESTPVPSRSNVLHFPALGNGTMSEKDEKFWGMFGHLISLTGAPTVGVGYVAGPLIAYFIKRDQSPFATEHSKESLNFGILTAIVLIVSAAAGFTAAPCVGWIPGAAALVFNLIYCVQGAVAAKNGEAFRYPINWRIIK